MPGAEPGRRIWASDDDITCVVLCGGKGSRLFPLTLKHQKSMLPVLGRPALDHVIDFWRPLADRFVFVVKHRKDEVQAHVGSLHLRAECVEPEELTGIADGIYRARELVGERFIVVLGDCICAGELRFPDQMQQGIVVWPTDRPEDIRRSYSVELSGDLVTRVVEKPTDLPNDLCGTGFYFFDRRVFSYIERQQPSKLRGEKEITDVLQSMIDGGERLSAVGLNGGYVNVTFPEDLARAAHVLLP